MKCKMRGLGGGVSPGANRLWIGDDGVRRIAKQSFTSKLTIPWVTYDSTIDSQASRYDSTARVAVSSHVL